MPATRCCNFPQSIAVPPHSPCCAPKSVAARPALSPSPPIARPTTSPNGLPPDRLFAIQNQPEPPAPSAAYQDQTPSSSTARGTPAQNRLAHPPTAPPAKKRAPQKPVLHQRRHVPSAIHIGPGQSTDKSARPSTPQ